MTTVLFTPNQTPILKDVVNRVLNECGVPTQSDLTTSIYTGVTVAINAVNDAVNDIYYRNRWEWAKQSAAVVLQAGVVSYPMPANFNRLCAPPCPSSGGLPLNELTQEEWFQYIPQNTTAAGTPYNFYVDGNTINFYPAPDSGYIALVPQFTYVYFKAPQRPLAAADQNIAIDVPPEFIEAVVAFAKWKMKLFLESPDWQADAQRYEQALHVQMANNNKGRRKARMRQTYPSNSVW